jgi:hypothetical protein
MNISSTTEYLKILDEIAEFIERDNLTIQELKELDLKKRAVAKFEMQEVNKYPAKQSLIDDYNKNKFLLN